MARRERMSNVSPPPSKSLGYPQSQLKQESVERVICRVDREKSSGKDLRSTPREHSRRRIALTLLKMERDSGLQLKSGQYCSRISLNRANILSSSSHGYEVNSNGLSRHGQRGDSKPHVNASAKSNQGTEETVHIDWNGNVEPKVPRKREPRLRYEVNKDGDTFVRRTGH